MSEQSIKQASTALCTLGFAVPHPRKLERILLNLHDDGFSLNTRTANPNPRNKQAL
jgi:hypothetical protein